MILYHGHCTDGFCSAWIAHKIYGKEETYVAVNYGESLPDVQNQDVLMLDFSYKRPELLKLLDSAKSITIIDHHKTAVRELEQTVIDYTTNNPGKIVHDKLKIIFDLTKSGAMLTWEYLYPTDTAPQIVQYVQDRDLWNWKLPNSKQINACLSSQPIGFGLWDVYEKELQSPSITQDWIKEGSAILRYQQQVVDEACKNAVEIEMDGYKVLSMNTTTMVSEIGEQLCKDRPFSATYFIRASDNKKIWSLRSRGNGIDVSEIAKKHGGGGHKQAAGFQE